MVRGKLVSDYLGRNEKTKVVAKLQKKGSGPPVREPALDEQTQKVHPFHYYSKNNVFSGDDVILLQETRRIQGKWMYSY